MMHVISWFLIFDLINIFIHYSLYNMSCCSMSCCSMSFLCSFSCFWLWRNCTVQLLNVPKVNEMKWNEIEWSSWLFIIYHSSHMQSFIPLYFTSLHFIAFMRLTFLSHAPSFIFSSHTYQNTPHLPHVLIRSFTTLLSYSSYYCRKYNHLINST